MSNTPYVHAEAYCLLTYANEDHTIVEVIWNSRDGVTPFCIRSRDGTTELQHVDWQLDRRDPNHTPKPGDRIFRDMTPERAGYFAEKRVEQAWDHPDYPIKGRYESREAAIEAFTRQFLQPGEPDLVEVPEK